jgi:pimeloyl-ACP methyl ester carboxylesterase
MNMRSVRRLMLAAVPGAATYATWRYRQVVRELDSLHVTPPRLPGTVRVLPSRWGRVAYRIHEQPGPGPALVLLHGWGRTADSAWWPIIQRSRRTVLAIDLPGHGRSVLDKRFTFSLAAEAVMAAIDDARLERPVLVGHSMGGPVALTAVLWGGAEAFSAVVALATSAYWVRPRQMVMVASAPYVLGPGSPVTVRNQRNETRRAPDEQERIAWEYAVRPDRKVLMDSALELRKFDARRWSDLHLPPTTWVVTANDGIIDAADQRRSAERFATHRVDLPCEHSAVIEAPDRVMRILEAVATHPDRPTLVAV